MQLGMIGLGRMGANMVRRLLKKGHDCVVFDRSPQAVGELVKRLILWNRRQEEEHCRRRKRQGQAGLQQQGTNGSHERLLSGSICSCRPRNGPWGRPPAVTIAGTAVLCTPG